MKCLFIGGINRAGTTLLQSILCSDSTTNPLIHEASYLRGILGTYEAAKQKFDEHGRYYFRSCDALREFTARWALDFLEQTRSMYPGSETLVLKHPPLTAKFPLLNELLGETGIDLHFYIVVRDPRDVVASLVRIGERLRLAADPEGNTLPRDMNVLAGYYMNTYMPALSSQDPVYRQRLLLVRYEDLVTNPGSEVNRLRESSGLALDKFRPESDWSRDDIDYASLRASGNAWLSELWGKRISPDRIGSFRQVLTGDEIRILEAACAGPLTTFGYNQSP